MINRKSNRRRGFTLVEMLVGVAISTILVLGMGGVLYTIFGGIGESRDFSNATDGVDLIRQLTFDARTGERILFPAADGPGDYTAGGLGGDMVQFDALVYDPAPPGTTQRVKITWASQRPNTASAGDPYTVNRWTDDYSGGGDVFTFGQDDINSFEVERLANNNFDVSLEASSGDEDVEVQLSVTLRNVRQ